MWEETSKSTEVSLSCEGRKASFHEDYSCGTAAIRGTKALAEGQHFWEIKMTSAVYGTDMVGTGGLDVGVVGALRLGVAILVDPCVGKF